MSSMRNAVTRRPHKERSQPQAREKWGILEKHKARLPQQLDYSLRAKDYNQKKAKLAVLSSKAKERNPDEFAFGMLSAGTSKQGKHGRGEETNRLSHDAVKLLKTQDAGYLRTVAGRSRRELEKLEEVVWLEKAMGQVAVTEKKKTIFVEPEKQGTKRKSDAMDEEENTTYTASDEATTADEASTQRATKKQQQAEQKAKFDLRAQRKKRKHLADMRAAKLNALKKRQEEIMVVAEVLERQRAKMAHAIGGVNKEGVKWKIRERKR